MSVTYPADPLKPHGDPVEAPRAGTAHDEPFVPVYARRGKARGGQGKIRTWMILTPIAVLVLGGIGAMPVLQGAEEPAAPLAEPARTGPVLSVTPIEPAVAPLTTASTPEPVVAAPPVVREAAPLRRISPAPARRETARTPARVPAPAAAAAPRVVTPAPTGPQAYRPAPAPSTATLNTAPRTAAPATPAPTPPPPVVIVEPIG